MKVIRSIITAAALSGLAATCALAEARFLTASDVERSGGYVLDLGQGKTAKVVRIVAPEGSGKACRVDVASLKKLILKSGRKGPDRTAATFPISMRYNVPGPDSAHLFPYCSGAGTGCTIIVIVPF